MTTEGVKRAVPAGTWESPITARSLSLAGKRLSHPTLHNSCVYWIEGRPAELGRAVLVERDAKGNTRDLTPPPYDVRSRVHEYGGGSYRVTDSAVYFVNARDQGLYRIAAGKIQRIFHIEGMRIADFILDSRRNRLIGVAEDHTGAGEPQNFLCGIDLDNGNLTVIHRGADFYSSPTLDNNGEHLAWLSWMHPQMPWDETRLHRTELDQALEPYDDATIVRQGEALFQPQFGPDGRLYFASDRDGWWNLYAMDSHGSASRLTHERADLGMAQWVFGMSVYGFVDHQTIAAARVSNGLWDVVSVNLETGQLAPLAPWPYTAIDHFCASAGSCVALAGHATAENRIVLLDLDTAQITTLQTASPDSYPPHIISSAAPVSFPTSGDDTAHGFFYPPCNPRFCLPDGTSPPLIVNVHGGPTTASTAGLNPRFQFWTSRGFAILDVNYRGSTGYGRDYRRKLDGAWGLHDVQDCVHGARFLLEQGLVNPQQLFIMGGSAGGYTVLSALAFTDFFHGGISSYGIGDLAVLAHDTHKFEARYADRLIGPFDESLYRQRSPLFAASNIKAPVLFFQGTDDKVVPPNQTESMVAALKRQHIPTAYVSMDGEGHGFRRSDSIEKMLDASLSFLCRLIGVTPAGGAARLHIHNEKQLQTR